MDKRWEAMLKLMKSEEDFANELQVTIDVSN